MRCDQGQRAPNHLSTRGPPLSGDLHSYSLTYYWKFTIFTNYNSLSTPRTSCIQFNATDFFAITDYVIAFTLPTRCVMTTLNCFE